MNTNGSPQKNQWNKQLGGHWIETLIFQFPIYLEPLPPRQGISGNDFIIDPWWTKIYGERKEDEGFIEARHPNLLKKKTDQVLPSDLLFPQMEVT